MSNTVCFNPASVTVNVSDELSRDGNHTLTVIELEVEDSTHRIIESLTAEGARRLAALLNEAADNADEDNAARENEDD